MIVLCILVIEILRLSGISDWFSMDKYDGEEEGMGTDVIETKEGWISGLCRRVFHLLGGNKRVREEEEGDGEGRRKRRKSSGGREASEGEVLLTVEEGGIVENGSIEVNEKYLQCIEMNMEYLLCSDVNEEYK